jgi:polyferredoxin
MLLILFGMIGGALPLVAQEAGRRRPPSFTEFLLQPKFITMFILAAVVFFLLKTHRMRKGIKVSLLLISTLLYGVVGNFGGSLFSSFAMHPSPMCAAAKPFLFGLRTPFMVMLSVMFLLTLIGPKLFCGWICPVGAVQELASMAARKLKLRRRKPRYSHSYGIRLAIFLTFLVTAVTGLVTQTVQDQVVAVNLYDYINPFHGFEFEWAARLVDNIIHYLPFLLTLALAFRYYRPFCHFVCPIGLYTHVLEQTGLYRISLIRSKCTDCAACTKLAPCRAFPDILKDADLRPECFACDECVDICPEVALEYGIPKTR